MVLLKGIVSKAQQTQMERFPRVYESMKEVDIENYRSQFESASYESDDDD